MNKIWIIVLTSILLGIASCNDKGKDDEIDDEYWKVTWELNGGAWPSGDNHVTKVLKEGTLAEPAAPEKKDGMFDGWYKEAALTVKFIFPYDVSDATGNITLYAKWKVDDSKDYQLFISIDALEAWLEKQPVNTLETVYKIGLKGVNLDEANGWGRLGLTIGGNKEKFVKLDLQNCSGTAIPNGAKTMTWEGPKQVYTVTGAFVDCKNLVAIKLPAGITSIGNYTFYQCSRLELVSIREGLESIGNYAFYSCSKLSDITLPKGLKTIGESAFSICSSLTSVTLPDGILSINNAFSACGLVSINIPASITSLVDYAFYGASKLQSIVLPEGFKSVPYNAFAKCEKLASVTLPDGLISIENAAFESCKSLVSINIPASVTDIGRSAFYNCESLKSVTLSENLTVIELNAFNGCTVLESIIIPAKVNTIESGTFNNCTLLSSIILKPATPPTLSTTFETFDKTAATLVIKVPTASVEAYKAAEGWKNLTGKIVADN